MRIISIYNLKGGVGKTAISVNLSYLAAEQGYRTLLWDLDIQGSTTYYFRVKPKIKGGLKKLIRGKSNLGYWIRGTNYDNLDLLPSDSSYKKMESLLDRVKHPKEVLSRRLKSLKGEYDYVFLDCPPGFSIISESIIRAAGIIIVPLIPTTLSMRSLDQLYKARAFRKKKPHRIMPLISMFDRRKKLHRELQLQLLATHPLALHSNIPYAIEVELMGQNRSPLFHFASRSKAALCFRKVWYEIEGRIKN